MTMLTYAPRRLLAAIPMLLAVVCLAFVMVHVAPGDPVYVLAGEGGTPELYDQVRREFGLDRSLPEQLGTYLAQVARGDLGRSLQQRAPVLDLILQRLPQTLLLAGTAFVLSSAVGIATGIWTAARPYGAFDRAVLAGTAVLAAVPVFWSGLLLVVTCSLWLGWFPAQGMTSARVSGPVWLDIAHHLVLPVVTLSLQPAASLTRLTRAKVLEALHDPYVLTARAKGLTPTRVLQHAARNALLPVVTVLGGSASMLVTGAVLTETVFAWPGLGRLALDATLARDYPVLIGTILVASTGTVALNLLADILYAVIDPRVTYA